jgi:hypothetical protein
MFFNCWKILKIHWENVNPSLARVRLGLGFDLSMVFCNYDSLDMGLGESTLAVSGPNSFY